MEIPYIVTPRKDTGLFNSKIAIWLFLASEVMLFGGFFSAYVFLRLGADYPWPERTLPVLPGLINTFNLISVFGTGDPRMLSSGISEALITTMYGLIVAIPALLLHAVVSRKAKGLLASMEQAAVAFVNGTPKRSAEE